MRTLIWFLVTVLVTSGGVLLVSGNRPPEMGGAGPPMFLLASTQLAKARAEYESGGKAALEKHLRSLEEDWGVHGVMTDGEGRDLVTGADQSELMRRARRRPPMFRGLPMFQRGRPSFAAPSEDGRYWFIVRFPESLNERSSLLLPHEAWVIGSVALLCFLFARGVTSPVRKLRAAVQEFGQGNLTARADLKRGDEFGQLAEAFNQMAQRIANLLSSQRRLLADLSHEIRTPLTRLGLAVELARTGGDRPAALDRIQREADRL
ncbi:MAG: HAMP domain-containing protein, partial [Bryobacterales bacterium]|nr:HAMP domain-containing protein [Bryobacterales bacterium]